MGIGTLAGSQEGRDQDGCLTRVRISEDDMEFAAVGRNTVAVVVGSWLGIVGKNSGIES